MTVMANQMATGHTSWAPLPDEELTWFLADSKLFALPRPLEYTLEVHAIVFGLTYALESLEFPLYALRSRRVNGRVYLAAVPSASAERDLPRRLRHIHDQSVRFTGNIQDAWNRQIKPEIELYNRWLEETASFDGSAREFEKRFCQLQRQRGNQWFTAIRGVVAPAVLLRRDAGESAGSGVVDLAEDLAGQALASVAGEGGKLLRAILQRVGERFSGENIIEAVDDIFRLEWMEVRALLQTARDRRALVAERKAEAGRHASLPAPASIGPSLCPDAPRMYLLPEVLELLSQKDR
jgi:hypothetical protein